LGWGRFAADTSLPGLSARRRQGWHGQRPCGRAERMPEQEAMAGAWWPRRFSPGSAGHASIHSGYTGRRVRRGRPGDGLPRRW